MKINEYAEFACRVCYLRMKEDEPFRIGCAWHCLDNTYCPAVLQALKEKELRDSYSNVINR